MKGRWERERRNNYGSGQGDHGRARQKEEKRRQKNTKREVLKECVSVWFLRRHSISVVKWEIWRVVVVFLGGTFWRSLRIGLTWSLRLGLMCWCLMWLTCLFPFLLWSLSFAMGCLRYSDRELVKSHSFSFSKKSAHSWTAMQEEMKFEGWRRTMPPTPLQISYSSFEEEQVHSEVEQQIWSARDRTIVARTKQHLEESYSMKVEVGELESLLGPDDSGADFRRILEEARDEKGCAIFETFAQMVWANSW